MVERIIMSTLKLRLKFRKYVYKTYPSIAIYKLRMSESTMNVKGGVSTLILFVTEFFHVKWT